MVGMVIRNLAGSALSAIYIDAVHLSWGASASVAAGWSVLAIGFVAVKAINWAITFGSKGNCEMWVPHFPQERSTLYICLVPSNAIVFVLLDCSQNGF